MFLAYLILIAAIGIFSYYGIEYLLKRWNEAQQKKAEQTASQFEEMFIFLKKRVIIFIYIIVPLGLGTFSFIFFDSIWIAIGAGAIGAVLPIALVKFMDARRRSKFMGQMVDSLMIMNSCLKGGLTLVQSFEVLAEETNPPMSQEISLLNREIKMGVTLEEALLRLEKRMPSEEMTLIISAVLVARETGGDLTKVFSRLVETIRDRIKLRELVATLTIQARLQSIIISLIGPVFFVSVRKMRPEHFNIMWENEVGRLLLIAAIFLQVVGIFLIVKLGKVEI